MSDLHELLTGDPSKVSQLDLDVRDQFEEKAKALREARQAREELIEKIEDLRSVLDRKKGELEEVEELNTLMNGEAPAVDQPQREVQRLQGALHEKESELEEVEKEIEKAQRALQKAKDEAVEELREQMKEIRDEAMQRIDEGLNAAQAATMELRMLRGVVMELPYDLKLPVPFNSDLLPGTIAGGASVLQSEDARRKELGCPSELQANPDPALFREWRYDTVIEARSVEPMEDDGGEDDEPKLARAMEPRDFPLR